MSFKSKSATELDPTVAANTAKVSADGSVTTHNDVTNAGSGAIVTVAERAELHTDHANRAALDNVSGTNTGDELDATEVLSGTIELATQAEVDAGTDAVRAVTPATLAASTAGTVARKLVSPVVLTTQTSPWKATSSATWESMGRMRFPGTNDIGIPTDMFAILHRVAGAGTGELRIWDEDNSLVVALTTGIIDAVPTIHNLGAISNLSATPVIWEIQAQRVGGGTTFAVSFFAMEF